MNRLGPTGRTAIRYWARIGLTVVRIGLAERITFLAASIAYYAFVSVIPLLVLAVAIGSFLGGEWAVDWLLGRLEVVLAPAARELVREAMLQGSGRVGAATASILVFLWSGLKVFRGLDLAFSQIYGTTEADTFLGNVRNAIIAFGAVGIGCGLVIGIGAVTVLLPGRMPFGSVVSVLGMTGSLIIVFLPLYLIFPGRPMTIRTALPGATVAAVGWGVLGTAFGVYTAVAGLYALYGVLGGILLLITLFYFASTILLLGAVVNAVLAEESGPIEDR